MDTHARILRLLNQQAGRSDPEMARLRVQLAALLAHSEEEQALVYEAFDRYVARYSFAPAKTDGGDKEKKRRQRQARRLRTLFLTVSLSLALLVLLGILARPTPYLVALTHAPSGTVLAEVRETSILGRMLDREFPRWFGSSRYAWETTDGQSGTQPRLALRYDRLGQAQQLTLQVQRWWRTDTLRYTFPQPQDERVELIRRQGQPRLVKDSLGRRWRFTPELREEIQLRQGTDAALAPRWGPAVSLTASDSLPVAWLPALREASDTRLAANLLRGWDSLQQAFLAAHAVEVSHTWDLGDGTQADGPRASHTFAPDSSYRIRYLRRTRYRHRQTGQIAYQDSLRLETELDLRQPEPPPVPPNLLPVPLPEVALVEEDISDLLRLAPSYRYVPSYLSLLLLLLYGLYELYRWWRARVVLDASQATLGPPLSQQLQIEPPEAKRFAGDTYDQAFVDLRRRAPGEGLELNLPLTLDATIRQGDVPDLRYTAPPVSSQYLVLIDRASYGDHLARYFADMVREMNQRDISAEVYFFQEHPRLCLRQFTEPESEVSLARLSSLYDGYRLLVFSEGDGLLDPYTLTIDPSARLLAHWDTRALLSLHATELWGPTEQQLQVLFPVLLPATPQGLALLLSQWEADTPSGWREVRSEYLQPAPAETDLAELRTYLGPQGFQWLCACAVYPELHYELTLRLGEIVGGLGEAHRQGYAVLYRLFSLPDFRRGQLDPELRLALYEALDPAQAQRTRALLIALLTEEPSQAPEGSYARQDQQATLAIYQYMNSARSAEDQAQLEAAFADHDPYDLRDVVTLRDLDRATRHPLALVLPRSAFRGKIPFFGLRQVSRLLLGLLLPLALVWIGYLGYWLVEKGQADEDDPYRYVELQTEQDSLRYYRYRLWALTQDSSRWQAGDSILATYQQVQPLVDYLLPRSEPGDSVWRQAEAFYYRALRGLYQAERYAAASQLWLSPQVEASYNADLKYVQGLARLMQRQVPAALPYLMELLTPLGDSGSGAAGAGALRATYCFAGPTLGTNSDRTAAPSASFYRDSTRRSLFRRALPPSRTRLIDLLRDYGDPDSDSVQTLLGWLTLPSGVSNLRVTLSESVGCAPFSFTAQATADKPIAEYRWSLTNDRLREEAQPRYRLDQPGDYDLRLTVRYADGSRDTLADIPTVRVVAPLDLAIRSQVSAGDPATFTFRASANQAEQYGWDFGDGNQGQGFSVAHTYAQAGRYPVRLIASNPCGADTTYDTVAVTLDILPPVELPTMIRIPGGSFMMGSEDISDDEKPVHQVQISTFYMAETEVTNAQFAAFLNAKGNQEEGGRKWYDPEGAYGEAKARIQEKAEGRWQVQAGYEQHPVNYVSWYGARAYCQWLSEETGDRYRLPSEAEWEYAAGGGTVDRDSSGNRRFTYSGSDDLGEVGWYTSNTNDTGTRPVRQKKANGLGLYDMSGNVWEWCADWYGGYASEPQVNPQGPAEGSNRVYRGGGWYSGAGACRVAHRFLYAPGGRYSDLGFRVARQF